MIDLKHYGYIETEKPIDGLIPGRVTEHRKEQYKVVTELGEFTASLKGSFYFEATTREDYPCIGDFVLLQYNANGPSQIAKILPRRSKFSRADYSGHAAGYVKTILEQVVAANIDIVFIISSMNNDFNVRRIERYITQARQSGGRPVVLLTKADLAADPNAFVESMRGAAPDVPVHAISNITGSGYDGLSDYLQPGVTAVFLGMSGVGKSSLLNALMGSDVMTVKEIREDDSRGRHTTTHRQLFTLPCGAMIIDTPGMRELGIFDSDAGISSAFADVEELTASCRFTNCRHANEPGCAVLGALADGTLSHEHWSNYQNQKRELRFVDDKSAYIRDKSRRNKELSMWNKKRKKSGGNER